MILHDARPSAIDRASVDLELEQCHIHDIQAPEAKRRANDAPVLTMLCPYILEELVDLCQNLTSGSRGSFGPKRVKSVSGCRPFVPSHLPCAALGRMAGGFADNGLDHG